MGMPKLLAVIGANERPCSSANRSTRNAREFADLQSSRDENPKKPSAHWRSEFKTVSGSIDTNIHFAVIVAIGRTRFDAEKLASLWPSSPMRGVCLAPKGGGIPLPYARFSTTSPPRRHRRGVLADSGRPGGAGAADARWVAGRQRREGVAGADQSSAACPFRSTAAD